MWRRESDSPSRYAPTWWFGELADDAPDFGPSTPAALLAALPTEWNGDWLMSLWDTCGVVPGFANLIEQADWRELSPPQRMYLLRFFTDLRWHQDRHALDPRRWRAIELLDAGQEGLDGPPPPRVERVAGLVPSQVGEEAEQIRAFRRGKGPPIRLLNEGRETGHGPACVPQGHQQIAIPLCG